MAEPIEVTQADRDAYFELHLHTRSLLDTDYRARDFREKLDRGKYDDWGGVQAFARHRITAERQAREAERAACAEVASNKRLNAPYVDWVARDNDRRPAVYNEACDDIAAAINARSTL